MSHHIDNEQTRARILRASRILGGEGDEVCRHCDAHIILYAPHKDDCILRKVNPEALRDLQVELKKKVRKDINKQRIFKSDKKHWNGLPAGSGGTLVKRKGARAKANNRDIRWCRVCSLDRLFISNKCRECEHDRPCAYRPIGKNCARCHPGEQRG